MLCGGLCLSKNTSGRGLPTSFCGPAAGTVKKIGGFGLKEYSTLDALNSATLPFLFITGTADETVPYEMTVQNFMLYKQRFPEKTKLVLFEKVPHAISYLLDSPRYEKELTKFLEKWGI